MKVKNCYEKTALRNLPKTSEMVENNIRNHPCKFQVQKFTSRVPAAYVVELESLGTIFLLLGTMNTIHMCRVYGRVGIRAVAFSRQRTLEAPLKLKEVVVFEHLKQYVPSLSAEVSGKFLRFLSGHEVISDNIFVTFNGATIVYGWINLYLILPGLTQDHGIYIFKENCYIDYHPPFYSYPFSLRQD